MNGIKFVVLIVQWRDKAAGNPYYSARIVRCRDGRPAVCPFHYGGESMARTAALVRLAKMGWLPKAYREGQSYYRYERENGYPILWFTCEKTKKECIDHGEL